MLGRFHISEFFRHRVHHELPRAGCIGLDRGDLDFLPQLHWPLDVGANRLAVRLLGVASHARLWYVACVVHVQKDNLDF